MTQEKQILVLTCLVVVLPIVLTAECPRKEDIAPCTCVDRWNLFAVVECGKIDNEGLARVASHLRGREVLSLTIADSTLGSIPHDVFKGIVLLKLRILRSTLSALTDGSEALVGLEDHLRILQIFDCVFESKWDWSVLRNLKILDELAIIRSLHLETIGEDFLKSSLSSVRTFVFGGNNVPLIVSDYAFDSFKNIKYLEINSNKIKNVKRTMLPNPALKLISFSVSNNEIEKFPEDMFTNMPNLQYLYIDRNKILVLDQKTFSPVWEQLVSFRAYGNPFRCHCSMSWIAENRPLKNLQGGCASPPLNGTELNKLKPKHFAMCVMCNS